MAKVLIFISAFVLLVISMIFLYSQNRNKPSNISITPTQPAATLTPSPTIDPTAAWTVQKYSKYSLQFKYPDIQADKQFIGTSLWQWPPKLTSYAATAFACPAKNNLITNDGIGTQSLQTIGQVQYCVKVVSQGAAGTSYYVADYTGKTALGNVTLETKYSLVNCGNFSEEKMTDCTSKEAAFKNNLPGIMDQIFKTIAQY